MHSEIEKEEEEQVFFLSWSLKTGWGLGGGSIAKIGSDSNARKVKEL